MASYFQVLFNATSPPNWRVLLVNSFGDWKSLASNTVLGIVVWIGDLFLVSTSPNRNNTLVTLSTGVPMLRDFYGLPMGRSFSWSYLPQWAGYVRVL